MIEYGTNVVGVTPGRRNNSLELPVFNTVDAVDKAGADTTIIFCTTCFC
jgi:succinyl-CoA synthetase alpha subunit